MTGGPQDVTLWTRADGNSPQAANDSPMFSQTVEYALRAVVFLAQRSPAPQKTADIAAATQVPSAYLAKVLQGLREKDIVLLQRGVGGGVSLALPPDELTILTVVNAVDPIKRINSCPLELKSHGVRLCALHRRMDNAMMEMEQAFESTTLSELLEDPNPSVPLCDISPRKRTKK